MGIELIIIGDELLKGDVSDRHTPYLSAKLFEKGLSVDHVSLVRDRQADIVEALLKAQARSPIVLVTGGLGATLDDITIMSAARAFDLPVDEDPPTLEKIGARFRQMGQPATPNNRQQAFVLKGSTVFQNRRGIAPASKTRIHLTTYYFMPGVPQELTHLFETAVLPDILDSAAAPALPVVKTYSFFGVAEARIDQLIRTVAKEPSISVHFKPEWPFNHLKIIIPAACPEASAKQFLGDLENCLHLELDRFLFSTRDLTFEQELGAKLTEKGLTLSIAESCTGGYIGHLLTQVPGASKYFKLGVVVYSNEAKTDVLGVTPKTLLEHGAVSAPTSTEMAERIQLLGKTDLGLSITGILGPEGGSIEKPVGTVFCALKSPQAIGVKKYNFTGDRQRIKSIAAYTALNMVRKAILEIE